MTGVNKPLSIVNSVVHLGEDLLGRVHLVDMSFTLVMFQLAFSEC